MYFGVASSLTVDKHLLNIAREMAVFFCFKISSFQLVCILKDLVLRNWLDSICLKVLKLFILFFLKAVI